MTPVPGYGPDTDLGLDKIDCELTDCQCQVLQKRPQAWKNAVTRMRKAATCFWKGLAEEEKTLDMKKLHHVIMDRLDFFSVKLEGLENYTHVSLERLNLQRQVVSVLESR